MIRQPSFDIDMRPENLLHSRRAEVLHFVSARGRDHALALSIGVGRSASKPMQPHRSSWTSGVTALGMRIALELPGTCDDVAMKIIADGSEVSNVVLWLSKSKVTELRGALADLLDRFEEPGFHAHVASKDYQTEVTIAAGTTE